jgi:hypothetical protein
VSFFNTPSETNPLANTRYPAEPGDDRPRARAFSARAAAAYEVQHPSVPQIFAALPSPPQAEDRPINPVLLGSVLALGSVALFALVAAGLWLTAVAAPNLVM